MVWGPGGGVWGPGGGGQGEECGGRGGGDYEDFAI